MRIYGRINRPVCVLPSHSALSSPPSPASDQTPPRIESAASIGQGYIGLLLGHLDVGAHPSKTVRPLVRGPAGCPCPREKGAASAVTRWTRRGLWASNGFHGCRGRMARPWPSPLDIPRPWDPFTLPPVAIVAARPGSVMGWASGDVHPLTAQGVLEVGQLGDFVHQG